MKKLIRITLTLLMLIPVLTFSTLAVDNKIIWSEDFSKVTTFDQLNWPKINSLKQNNTEYSIVDGRLFIHNAKGDSYVVMVPESVMKDVIKDDYTVQYTFEYKYAGNDGRYLAVLLNYDPVLSNSYNSLHIRMRGDGNWENRFMGTWSHMEATGDTGALAMTNTGADAWCQKVFGIPYAAGSTTNIAGKTLVVRQEVHMSKKKVDIYINDVLVTTTTDIGWDYFMLNKDFSAIALKVGDIIDAYVDNIYVATGIGIPLSAVTTAAAPSTTAAPVTTAGASGGTTTPPTSDSMVSLYAAAAMLAAVSAAVVIKRKVNNK